MLGFKGGGVGAPSESARSEPEFAADRLLLLVPIMPPNLKLLKREPPGDPPNPALALLLGDEELNVEFLFLAVLGEDEGKTRFFALKVDCRPTAD